MKETKWPLSVIDDDGNKIIYKDYEDFVRKGNKETRQSVGYRVRMTKQRGHFKNQQWIYENDEKYSRKYLLDNTSFICEFCGEEKPCKVESEEHGKKVNNFVVVEADLNDELNTNHKAKRCMECYLDYCRNFWGDLTLEDLSKPYHERK